MLKNPANKNIFKWLLIAFVVVLVAGLGVYFYYASLTHEDTAGLEAEYNVEAIPFIREFENDYKEANKKYAEKIIAVKGVVTATLAADTTMNIEMKDTASGSYLIFAFQDQHMQEARKLKPGDVVTIKGSCSDGIFSEILGTYFVSFKRSTIEN